MRKKYEYPNIEVFEDDKYFNFRTVIRIKRDSIWYDINVNDFNPLEYGEKRALEYYLRNLIGYKNLYRVNLKGGLYKELESKSENQNDTTDDLLFDYEIDITKPPKPFDKYYLLNSPTPKKEDTDKLKINLIKTEKYGNENND